MICHYISIIFFSYFKTFKGINYCHWKINSIQKRNKILKNFIKNGDMQKLIIFYYCVIIVIFNVKFLPTNKLLFTDFKIWENNCM